MNEIKIPMDEKLKNGRQHVPIFKMSGVVCEVCHKVLGSQETDKPCPGPQTEVGE